MMAYRASVNDIDSTGRTPNMMMLGREVALPLHVGTGVPVNSEIVNASEKQPEDWVSQVQENLHPAHEVAGRNLKKSASYQKK